jgi:hypothetical protein
MNGPGLPPVFWASAPAAAPTISTIRSVAATPRLKLARVVIAMVISLSKLIGQATRDAAVAKG